jgi:hypothetical protein
MKTVLIVPLLALSVAACGGNKAANNHSANVAAPAGNATAAPAANGQAAATPAGAITPQEVRTMITRDGATATVRALNEGGSEAAPNRLATVMNGIAAGEQAWLDIVPLIRPGTDGETGEGLSMVLQDALSKNATGVLRLIGPAEDAQGVCGESATHTVRADRAAAITAVEAVADPALAQAKTACLTALRATAAQ